MKKTLTAKDLTKLLHIIDYSNYMWSMYGRHNEPLSQVREINRIREKIERMKKDIKN